MANSVIDVAKEAFANANYTLAMDLYEQILRYEPQTENSPLAPNLLMDTYFGYADSLARTGNIKESFDVYAFICSRLGHSVPLDRLKHLTIGLLDSVSTQMRRNGNGVFDAGPSATLSSMNTNATTNSSLTLTNSDNNTCNDVSIDFIDPNADIIVDPLACPICEDILMWPVTTVCGHTFCRQCCYGQTQCRVCGKRFLMYGDSFKQDVLISRLVEKWWTPDIQAQLLNVDSKTYLRQNLLDDALKSCNSSLEKSKYLNPHFSFLFSNYS